MSEGPTQARQSRAHAALRDNLSHFERFSRRVADLADPFASVEGSHLATKLRMAVERTGRRNAEFDTSSSQQIADLLVALNQSPFMREISAFPFSRSSSHLETIGVEAQRVVDLVPDILIEKAEERARNRSALRKITPQQSVGPARFAVEGDRLVIAADHSVPDKQTVIATDAARETLRDVGDQLIWSLAASNSDPRLVRAIEAINNLLAPQANVIRLGILNVGLNDTIASLESELSVSVALDLRTYSNGIRMYVGQFEDWAKFLENAVNAELSSEDGAALAAAADRVVQACKDQPEFADPEVPKTIIALRELLNDPAKAGKRAMFAMMRTLENLCVVAFDHIAGAANDTVKAARKAFAMGAGTAIGGVLLVIAAQAAGALGPIGARVPELKWVDQGLELAKKLTPKE